MFESKIKEQIPKEQSSFSELISDVSNTISELRAIAMDLRPSFLENVDIVDALYWHTKKVQESLGIQINVDAEDTIKIGSKLKDNIYRIYQESLNNAVKHAGATRLDVALKMNGKFLLFKLKDNGKGFVPAQADTKEKGLGLDTIRERVELLNGIFKIESSDKIGTSISIEVPVE
jgi:two-component system sensor histidine kinase NreB